ncbi:hypothetical protein [Amycolatopsis taiwanensis]|uniref:Uncharacterized protein n=2 Tax=Amycolatopsis taiwanensis TaxID=342230 RepID=A0A9W6QY18_9PSEU|nr:hypothetical protein [Amycolatopsis taiwanensis]GLY64965.1 hypothetical protein Atai01_15840 [Amycolatopsis taiwanensis]
MKDATGWGFNLDGETGQLTVTTPTGRQHRTQPETILKPTVEKPDESTKDNLHDDTEEPPF